MKYYDLQILLINKMKSEKITYEMIAHHTQHALLSVRRWIAEPGRMKIDVLMDISRYLKISPKELVTALEGSNYFV